MIRRRRGFTLIELIIVMAIIGILAGLVMTAAQSAKRRATMTKARAAISGLETALGMFQLDVGAYPYGAGTDNSNLVNCLTSASTAFTVGTGVAMTTAQVAAWSGPYMNFQANEIVGGNYVDPWGNAYSYTCPGTDHGTGANYSNYVDIWSNGPDGTSQPTTSPPDDDVMNWRR